MSDRFLAMLADELAPPEVVQPDFWAMLGVSLQPKQQLAEDLSNTVDELLYGGAAGGGKSWWLLPHLVARALKFPDTRHLLVRRVRPSLVRTLWPRMVSWCNEFGWGKQEQRLEVTLQNGSVIEFGGIDTEMDVHRYQGAEYATIAFEELTEFTEYQYTYMLSRARCAVPGVNVHLVSTTNPGGVGHSWVKARFVRPPEFLDDDETLRNVAEGVTVKPFERWCPVPNVDQPAPLSRVFVPATLDDNAALVESDPGYASRAGAGSSAGMRKALTSGDWDAIEAVEGALWSLTQIEADRLPVSAFDAVSGCVKASYGTVQLDRRLIMIDPAVSYGPNSDDTGMIVAARGILSLSDSKRREHRGFVLEDLTCHTSDVEWSRRAVDGWSRWRCDEIVIENNQGGDLLRTVVLTVAKQMLADGEIGRLPAVRLIRARSDQSKLARARPVAVLYGQHRIHHVGSFAKLEDQLSTWDPDVVRKSPDRLDAIAHAFTHLGLAGAAKPARAKKKPKTEEARYRGLSGLSSQRNSSKMFL